MMSTQIDIISNNVLVKRITNSAALSYHINKIHQYIIHFQIFRNRNKKPLSPIFYPLLLSKITYHVYIHIPIYLTMLLCALYSPHLCVLPSLLAYFPALFPCLFSFPTYFLPQIQIFLSISHPYLFSSNTTLTRLVVSVMSALVI